jgi:O-antigen ligase
VITRSLFKLLILLLPTQFAYHFWPNFAFVYGIRVDYLSPTVFLTDLVIIALICSYALKVRKIFPVLTPLFILFAFFNIIFSMFPVISLYYWLKMIEFLLLALVVFKLKITKDEILPPLSIAVILTSFLSIAQFVENKSIGGIFYYLGERFFTANTPGIALINDISRLQLRPYATFPHPNVLAAFMLVSFILMKGSRKYLLIQILCLVVILLSFSQAVWLALAAVVLVDLLYKRIPKHVFLYLIFFVFIASLGLPLISVFFIKTLSGIQSVYLRQELAVLAGFAFLANPLFGIGLGSFIPYLPTLYDKMPSIFNFAFAWWLQPAHNVYLLVLTEMGLVGFLLLFYYITSLANKINSKSKNLQLVFIAVLLTGFFDHYWFTLQQSRLLLAICLGLFLQNLEQNNSPQSTR